MLMCPTVCLSYVLAPLHLSLTLIRYAKLVIYIYDVKYEYVDGELERGVISDT